MSKSKYTDGHILYLLYSKPDWQINPRAGKAKLQH